MIAFPSTSLVDVSHFSRDSLALLRARLVDELHTLAAQRAAYEATASQLIGETDVDSILERELAEASSGRAREAIDEIENALARLDLGTYGGCETCGVAIPVERLEAIPQTRFCVGCLARRAGMLSRSATAAAVRAKATASIGRAGSRALQRRRRCAAGMPRCARQPMLFDGCTCRRQPAPLCV